MQVTSLNCAKLVTFVAVLKLYAAAYVGITCGYVAHALLRVRNRVKKAYLAFCQLAVLKLLYSLLNLAFWQRCPWAEPTSQDMQNDNFFKSFKVTVSTLYQTMFCSLLLLMVMGY